jgi:uncharacterized membrane protein YqaE (UPF0057 family)
MTVNERKKENASVLLGGSVEGSCIRICYVNQQKFIQVAAFTGRLSQLGDSIERGAINAAVWMNFLLFFKSHIVGMQLESC